MILHFILLKHHFLMQVIFLLLQKHLTFIKHNFPLSYCNDYLLDLKCEQ